MNRFACLATVAALITSPLFAGQPSADSRVRQNLALVVGLQGRFPEAEQIARRELLPQQADANVAYLRGMLSQQNSWQKFAAKDSTSPASNTN